jgi:hypothetical protein
MVGFVRDYRDFTNLLMQLSILESLCSGFWPGFAYLLNTYLSAMVKNQNVHTSVSDP